MNEPPVKILITPESAHDAVKRALLLVAACRGGVQTYVTEANNHIAEIIDFAIEEEPRSALAHRVNHYLLGLTFVAAMALERLEAATGRDLVDVLPDIEEDLRKYFAGEPPV